MPLGHGDGAAGAAGECYYFKPLTLEDVDLIDPAAACSHFSQVHPPARGHLQPLPLVGLVLELTNQTELLLPHLYDVQVIPDLRVTANAQVIMHTR